MPTERLYRQSVAVLRVNAAVVLAVVLVAGAAPAAGVRARPVVAHHTPSWSPTGDRLTFVREIQTGARVSYSTWLVKTDRTVLRRFDDVKQSAWSPDGRNLALVWAGKRLFVTTSNGTRVRAVTRGAAPSWSPESDEIAFVRTSDSGRPTAFRLPLHGSGSWPRPVAPAATWSSSARWSPDGRWLAFVGHVLPTGTGLWLSRRNGEDLRRLLPDTGGRLSAPRWSPDGRHLLAWSLPSQRLVIVPLVAGAPRRLGLGSAASWSAGGSHIAYVQRCRVLILARDAQPPADAPVCSVHGFLGNPAWSPHGKRVAFHECFHDVCWIFVRTPRARERQKLGHGTQPAWSPDGRRIAFVRRGRVQLMNADGTRARPLLRREDSR